MKSQIDAITRYVEMGYRAFTGQVSASVYEKLACPAPVFAKWLLYQGDGQKKAVCVGCSKECKPDNLDDFALKTQVRVIDYKKPYAITPSDMVKRHSLLTAKQAAYCLNVSERTIYNMIAEGKLVRTRDNPVRVRASEVEQYMNDFDE